MSDSSDPGAIVDALAAATDAFNEEGHGIPTREERIDADVDWKTQLTKACRLLTAVERLSGAGLYTATTELCFGATERSVEAFALAEGGDELDDFHDHTRCDDRATELGLLSRETRDGLHRLYETNRRDRTSGPLRGGSGDAGESVLMKSRRRLERTRGHRSTRSIPAESRAAAGYAGTNR